MTEAVTVLTPISRSDAIELGRTTWRKQVLPVGSLDYKGRKLNFTKGYLDNLVTAFKARAFDAVPFQLADSDNRHNNDPLRAAGQVIGLEAADDGLYATVSLTDKGADLVREYPDFGVSVRIVEHLDRGDGSTAHDAALQHVLGTWDPRISSMSPWQPVECSQESEQVIDLSALTFADGEDTTQEEAEMPDAPSQQLTDAEVTRMRAILAEYDTPAPDAADGYTEPTDEELTAIAEQMLADLKQAPAAESVADVAQGEPEPVGAALSNEGSEAIELANARADRMEIELSRLRSERDVAAYEKLRDDLTREHGVPPYVTELARPLLLGAHTVELSNGTEINAGDIVRKVMTELAKARLVDLSRDPVYDVAPDADAEQDKIRQAETASYAQRFGLV